MKRSVWVLGSAWVLMMSVSLMGFAQDVELPLKWTGDGTAKFLDQDGLKTLDFKATIKVDTQGEVSGTFANDEGEVPLVRLYYGQEVGGARQIVMVLVDKESSEPMLFVLQARVLNTELVYGEVFVKPYEAKGSIEAGLYLDDPTAQEIYEDYMPSGLKAALKKCKPVGCFMIHGE